MKTDARVRYTKMRIREAFFQSLRQKPLNRITVREICDLAEINRATFYTHYSDPYDLMEHLEEECIREIETHLAEQKAKGINMLPAILRGVRNPDNPAALLASPNGDPGFADRITALCHRCFAPSVASQLPGASEEEKADIYRFLAGGCGSLISGWIREGEKTAPEEMAQRIASLGRVFIDACASQFQNSIRPYSSIDN